MRESKGEENDRPIFSSVCKGKITCPAYFLFAKIYILFSQADCDYIYGPHKYRSKNSINAGNIAHKKNLLVSYVDGKGTI